MLTSPAALRLRQKYFRLRPIDFSVVSIGLSGHGAGIRCEYGVHPGGRRLCRDGEWLTEVEIATATRADIHVAAVMSPLSL